MKLILTGQVFHHKQSILIFLVDYLQYAIPSYLCLSSTKINENVIVNNSTGYTLCKDNCNFKWNPKQLRMKWPFVVGELYPIPESPDGTNKVPCSTIY